MIRTILSLVAVVAATLVAAPAPTSAAEPIPVILDSTFSGVCTIRGTVIPFTDFSGSGQCTGTLDGVHINAGVIAVATATGTNLDPVPLLQTGSGYLEFPAHTGEVVYRFPFTFQQVGTTLAILGTRGGAATGEVVPLETSGSTRQAQVVATTILPLHGTKRIAS